MGTRAASLWRQPDFVRFWIGVSASLLGNQAALVAFPLIAALTLQATAGQMGLLLAAGRAPQLLVTLPAGVWIDRLQRRPILIAAELGRAVLLGSIPVAALLGAIGIELLYVVAFLAGTCQVFSEVAQKSYLPTILARGQLVDGNAKLSISRSVADGAGPSLAGVLIQLVGPVAIALNAVSFLVSATCLRLIRSVEPPPTARNDQRSVGAELVEGLQFLLRDPRLRSLNFCASTFQLFFNALQAVYVLYVTRDLGIEASGLGLIFAAGAPGALLGALLAEKTARRFGWGPTMIGSAAVITSSPLLIALAGGPPLTAILTLALSQFVMRLFIGIYSTHSSSLYQVVVPGRLLGRVSATSQFTAFGMMPIGSLLGGLLGEMLGVPTTMLLTTAATPLAMVWLVFSPVSKLRWLPEGEPAGATGPAVQGA